MFNHILITENESLSYFLLFNSWRWIDQSDRFIVSCLDESWMVAASQMFPLIDLTDCEILVIDYWSGEGSFQPLRAVGGLISNQLTSQTLCCVLVDLITDQLSVWVSAVARFTFIWCFTLISSFISKHDDSYCSSGWRRPTPGSVSLPVCGSQFCRTTRLCFTSNSCLRLLESFHCTFRPNRHEPVWKLVIRIIICNIIWYNVINHFIFRPSDLTPAAGHDHVTVWGQHWPLLVTEEMTALQEDVFRFRVNPELSETGSDPLTFFSNWSYRSNSVISAQTFECSCLSQCDGGLTQFQSAAFRGQFDCLTPQSHRSLFVSVRGFIVSARRLHFVNLGNN